MKDENEDGYNCKEEDGDNCESEDESVFEGHTESSESNEDIQGKLESKTKRVGDIENTKIIYCSREGFVESNNGGELKEGKPMTVGKKNKGDETMGLTILMKRD